MNPQPFESPAQALSALIAELSPVPSERIELLHASGRVLAEPVQADRPSPAADVSAMDGYAVRFEDLGSGPLPIAATVAMGAEPPAHTTSAATRITTGGGLPSGADTVIRREDVEEQADQITVLPTASPTRGDNIRRAGENLAQGAVVVPAGATLTPSDIGVLASFGATTLSVARHVRVAVISTGDELLEPSTDPNPWQIRDGNKPYLAATIDREPWLELIAAVSVADDLDRISARISAALESSDAVILSGGVSMGQRDFVPEAVRRAGGRVVFHRLPQRPGKPLFGAAGPAGQLVLACPGNPISVMVTTRRFAEPALSAIAGRAPSRPIVATLAAPDGKTTGLWWSRLAAIRDDGRLDLTSIRSSGDIAAAARADGFIELPPRDAGDHGAPFYPWAWS